MNVKQAWALIKQSVSSWSDDFAPSMGAALSYYTLFSIAPLLIIVISVAGLFFGADAVRGVIFAQLQSLMGVDGAKAIQDMLTTASHPATGGIATVVSIVGLLIGATTVFNELQDDLDRIWRAPARVKSSGLWTLLRTRLLSFGLIMGVAFLLAVSLVTSAAIAMLGKWWGAWFRGWETLAQVLDLALNFGLLTLIFAMIYKVIPRVQVSWRDVWTGAGVTSLLFTLGKFLIGLYLGKSDMASAFGAAGSMVLVMVWVYYSSQIFLFGAEFTWVYANMHGSRREIAKKEGTLPGVNADASSAGEPATPTRNDPGAEQPRQDEHRLGLVAADAASSATPAATRLTVQRSVSPYPPAPLAPRALPAIAPDTHPVRGSTSVSLRNGRIAVGVAIATAIVVGVAARFHALRRVSAVTRRFVPLR